MPTQTDVQQLIQSLGSSAVNNGNPNTVYNASPFPMTNGSGDWYYPVTNSMFLPQLGLPTTGLGGFGGGFFNVPNIGGGTIPTYPNIGGGTTPPPATDDGTPPPTSTGGGGGGGFTSGNPGTGTFTGGPFGSYQAPGGSGLLVSGINYGGLTLGGSGGAGTGGYSGGGSSSGGAYGSFDPGHGLWDFAPGMAGNLGLNPDGSISFGQLLDVLTEPFIAGNFYNSQNGTFNWGQLGQALTGIPGLNKLLDWLGRRQLNDNDPSNDNSWLAQLVKNKAINQNAKLNNILNASTNNIVAKNNNNLFNTTNWLPNPAEVNIREIPVKTPNVQVGDMINEQTGQVMPYVGGGASGGSFNPFTGTAVGGTLNGVYGAIPTASNGGNILNGYGSLGGGEGSYPGLPNAGTGVGQPSGTVTSGGTTLPSQVGGNPAASTGLSGYGAGSHGSDVITGPAATAAFAGLRAGSEAALRDAEMAAMRRMLR